MSGDTSIEEGLMQVFCNPESHHVLYSFFRYLCNASCVLSCLFYFCHTLNGILEQIKYKDSLGQGISIPDLPEVKRVQETQKNISSVEFFGSITRIPSPLIVLTCLIILLTPDVIFPNSVVYKDVLHIQLRIKHYGCAVIGK